MAGWEWGNNTLSMNDGMPAWLNDPNCPRVAGWGGNDTLPMNDGMPAWLNDMPVNRNREQYFIQKMNIHLQAGMNVAKHFEMESQATMEKHLQVGNQATMEEHLERGTLQTGMNVAKQLEIQATMEKHLQMGNQATMEEHLEMGTGFRKAMVVHGQMGNQEPGHDGQMHCQHFQHFQCKKGHGGRPFAVLNVAGHVLHDVSGLPEKEGLPLEACVK